MHALRNATSGNGTVNVAVDLACDQAERGHDVWFLSAPGHYDDVLRQHEVQLLPLPEPTSIVAVARICVRTIGLTYRIRPDIVHAHMVTSAITGAIASTFARAALVTTVHNSYKRHSALMRLGRVIVAVSDADRALLLEHGFSARRMVTVLNGTIGSFRERLSDQEGDTVAHPSVVTVCGLHDRKAVDDVIRAFALLHPQLPQWHLNIVGWGPDREMLESLVVDLALNGSVHFLGPTDSPLSFLRASQIFVTAALADPCPLGVIEARSMGCAIVGTAVGGIPELLAEGRAGKLVPPRDPEALAHALRPLMSEPAELEKWRDAALPGVEFFSVARMALEYDDAYRRAVRPSRRRWRLR